MTNVLVTGANRGIGLEFCRQLQGRGDRVVAVCRESSAELEALGVRVEPGIELTDAASRADLMGRLENLALDLVILNAGILQSMGLADLHADSVRQQFEVNALAPVLLARDLQPLMPQGAKLILMTSRMGSIDDNSSGGSYGYRMSKVALNMAGRSLSIDLKPFGIAVALLHPGLVRTRMTRFNPSGITPDQSVRGLLQRIEALTLETTGGFWHANGQLLPW